ncbi:polysaccharide biosynthesis protein, partial [Paenibacillus albiflavus]
MAQSNHTNELKGNSEDTAGSSTSTGTIKAAVGSSKLLKGAAILSLAAVISKLIGTMQKIPLQNIAGDEVFGLYNATYPFYLFLIFLATAGIPTAIALLVAERAAEGDHLGARLVTKASVWVMLASGLLFFGFMYFGADLLARFIGVAGTASSLRSIAWAMILVPVMSALRGHFQGYQDMIPSAVSQVVEQIVRVAMMVVLLLWLVHLQASPERIAAGALFGSVAGAAAGLLIILYAWYKWSRRIRKDEEHNNKHKPSVGRSPLQAEHTGALIRRIVRIAIPICLGTITVPLLNMVDTFTMPRLLHTVHLNTEEAMRQFGLFNHGQPLVQLVSMIAASVGAAIVPALSEASGNATLARSRAQAAMQAAWLIGLPSAAGLALTAQPVNVMLFTDAEGSFTMAVLGITALFSTLAVISTSVLNGLGEIRGPAVAMLAAVAVKIIGNV